MILSDEAIIQAIETGRIGVEPFDVENVQPCSLDIRLGNEIAVYDDISGIIDVRETDIEENTTTYEINSENGFVIEPDGFYLADTIETFDIPDTHEGELMGRSSLARLGIEIHSTAGLFDPGFNGQGVLEISNNSDQPIRVYPGMCLAQMVFKKLITPSRNSYNSEDNKYQGQQGAVPSRIKEDYDGT